MKSGLWCGLLLMLCMTFHVSAQDQKSPVEHLVFVSSPDGNDDILITDTLNGSMYNLTANPGRDWHPDWSPDGSKVVFTSDRDGSADIFIMNSNGTEVHNVTHTPDRNESAPSWSPDGEHLVYLVQQDKTFNLYTQSPNAEAKPEPLTSDGIEKGAPAWSPDSSQVAFWRKGAHGVEIVAENIQTGGEETLVSEGVNNWPAYSPDGTQLAFYRLEGKLARLYTLDLADHNLVAQSEDLPGVSDLQPAWSPRGTQLAFSSDRIGSLQIFVEVAFSVESPFGTFARPITHLKTPAHSPAWQPVASVIDFLSTMQALSQSVQVVENAEGLPNDKLGKGLLDISAPEKVTPDEVIHVRIELHPPKGSTASGPRPTSTAPSDVPSDENIVLRASKSVDVYQLMGAELTGFDLEENFDAMPSPTNYVIGVQPDDENYWEWWLQPKGPQAVGKHTFFVQIYLPEQNKDGRQIITKVINQQFTVEVTRSAPVSAAQAAPPQSNANVRMRVQFDSDHFSLIVLHPLDLNGFSISTTRTAIELDTVFDAFALADNNVVPANVCLHFVVYQTQPPLPLECHDMQNFSHDVGRGDVFWYDKTFYAYVPTIMRTPQMTFGVCPGDDSVPCEIDEDTTTP